MDVHWSAIGAFWASVSAAIVAVSATIINYLFFRSQTDPNVIVYATEDRRRPSIIILVIENIGKSMAKDIKFTFANALPRDAYGFESAPQPPILDRGPLCTGIPALGPGAKRTITWGQYGGLYKALGDYSVDVTISFRSESICFLFPSKFEVVCPLDIKSFEYTDDSDHNWDKKAVEQLKRIAKSMEKMSLWTKNTELSPIEGKKPKKRSQSL